MLDYINDIRKALDNDCWYSALALALTLPDICGEIEFKQFQNVGKRYRKWYFKHIESNDYFTVSNNQANIFTSKDCYLLRCAFLHSHSYDIDNEYLKNTVREYDGETYLSIQTKFELYASRDNTKSRRSFDNDLVTRIQTRKIRINVYYLCKVLCNEAEIFFNINKQQFIFNNTINLIDPLN